MSLLTKFALVFLVVAFAPLVLTAAAFLPLLDLDSLRGPR